MKEINIQQFRIRSNYWQEQLAKMLDEYVILKYQITCHLQLHRGEIELEEVELFENQIIREDDNILRLRKELKELQTLHSGLANENSQLELLILSRYREIRNEFLKIKRIQQALIRNFRLRFPESD